MERLHIVSNTGTATLITLPLECYLLLLSTMSKEQLEAFMRTNKKLREAYFFCEKRVRNLKSILMGNLQEFGPPALPLPSWSWGFLVHEGDKLKDFH
jgi:hypothetical protein